MKAKILGYRPLPGKLVVELAETESTTKSGIVLVQDSKVQMNQGRVCAVAQDSTVDGQELTPYVAVGDWVVFGQFAGLKLSTKSLDGKELVVLRESDIMVIVDYDFTPDKLPLLEARDTPEDVVSPDPINYMLEPEGMGVGGSTRAD